MSRHNMLKSVLRDGMLIFASFALTVFRMQGQTISFYRELTSGSGFPLGCQSVAVDATGIYLFGYTQPSNPGAPNRTWARKFDLQGRDLWTQDIDSCCIGGAATDPTGVYLVGGALFGPAFLRKYDRDGHELWTRQLDYGTSTDNSKVVTEGGGVYVATSGGQTSVRKFDRDGSQLWMGSFDASAQVATPGLAVTPAFVYLLGGRYNHSSIPIKKFDLEGRELWSADVPASSSFDWAPQIAADTTGFYVTFHDIKGNVLLAKYDGNSASLWNVVLSGIDATIAGLIADGTSVYATGTTAGLAGQCRSGPSDAFVRRFDTSGREVWTREFGPAQGAGVNYASPAMDTNSIYMIGGFLAKLEKAPAAFPVATPYISPGCVVNFASNLGGAVTPGEIVTISGSMIGPTQLVRFDPTVQPLAKTLADTRILFNGVPAPLLYVSATRSSTIVPYSIRGQSTVGVQVEYQGLLSYPVTMPVLDSRPGIYTVDGSGVGLGAILNEDGTVNSPVNPARRGSVITIYGTGGGEGDPAVVDGEVLQSILPKISLPVNATFDDGDEDGGYPNGKAEILYAGGAPGLLAGVFQINLRIPSAATSGEFFVTVGTQQVIGLAVALR